MLHGAIGGGKTRLALQHSMLTALGEPSLFKQAETPRKVLYLGLKDSEIGLQYLVDRILDDEGMRDVGTSALDANFSCYSLTAPRIVADYSDDALASIEGCIPEAGVDLVVIDSFSELHDSDEAHGQLMTYINNFIEEVASKFNCVVLYLHRSDEDGNPSGSFVIGEAPFCQSVWKLERVKSKKSIATHRLKHERSWGENRKTATLLQKSNGGNFRIIKNGGTK